jgi:hypothetical protein
MFINIPPDLNHPTINVKFMDDQEKMDRYMQACIDWKSWYKAESNRLWRNAYVAKDKPIPEEFGPVTPDDDKEIPFEKIIIE